jgi:DNA replication protein DnaC
MGKSVQVHYNSRCVKVFYNGEIIQHLSTVVKGRFHPDRSCLPPNKDWQQKSYLRYLFKRCSIIGPSVLEWAKLAEAHRQERAYRSIQGIVALSGKYAYSVINAACQRSIEKGVFSYHLVKQLATSAFVAKGENILMIGPPGVGKTHLACAFSIEAIHKGFTVLYRSVFDIAADIAKNTNQVIDHFLKPDLLLIDELGMKNMNGHANEIILEVIHRRYQRNSTIIATNRPIEDWGRISGDNAMASAILDRFLERLHLLKITGKSYRLKNMKLKEQKMVESNR